MNVHDFLKVTLAEQGGSSGFTWHFNEAIVPESNRIFALINDELIPSMGPPGSLDRRVFSFDPLDSKFPGPIPLPQD